METPLSWQLYSDSTLPETISWNVLCRYIQADARTHPHKLWGERLGLKSNDQRTLALEPLLLYNKLDLYQVSPWGHVLVIVFLFLLTSVFICVSQEAAYERPHIQSDNSDL